MIDEFIYRNRIYLIGGIIFLILVGLGTIVWEKYSSQVKAKQESEMAQLKSQNQVLRDQLSNVAKQISEQNQQIDQVNGVQNFAKINLNSASAAELDKLPNIGPARAQDIISYRQSHNGFKSIEELKNIKGIGDKSFESLKDLVTVNN